MLSSTPHPAGPGGQSDPDPTLPPRLDALRPEGQPSATPATSGGADRALTTAELRGGKPGRRAFLARPRLPVQLVLDGISRGYNVGALFWLCDAFLCALLVVCDHDASRATRKLVQAAQGTHGWVPWKQRDSTAKMVRAARAEDWQVVAVEQASGAVDLDRFALRRSVCLVLGSERAGVSRVVLDLGDAAVAIPGGAWPTRSAWRPPQPSSCTASRRPVQPPRGQVPLHGWHVSRARAASAHAL